MQKLEITNKNTGKTTCQNGQPGCVWKSFPTLPSNNRCDCATVQTPFQKSYCNDHLLLLIFAVLLWDRPDLLSVCECAKTSCGFKCFWLTLFVKYFFSCRYQAWASAEIFPGEGKVDISLIFLRLLAMQHKWTHTKNKCPVLRQQLHTAYSL